ncbi:MAG TPA: hypothetical protein DFS52_05630 [Myxococcales bacterium]|nr:hypothetical protein [Myxococcales bacterium]
MKELLCIALPLVLTAAACGSDEMTEPPVSEEPSNRDVVCSDAACVAGSAPATAASFDIDCTIETETSAYRWECTRLALRYELADGTVFDLSGLDQLDLYVQNDYLPGDGRQKQMLITVSAFEARLSDGRQPYLRLSLPHPLFVTGNVAAGATDADCTDADSCAEVWLGAHADGSSPYSLASVQAFSLAVAAVGMNPGERFALSAPSIPIDGAERNGLQAVCDDGRIHYK